MILKNFCLTLSFKKLPWKLGGGWDIGNLLPEPSVGLGAPVCPNLGLLTCCVHAAGLKVVAPNRFPGVGRGAKVEAPGRPKDFDPFEKGFCPNL